MYIFAVTNLPKNPQQPISTNINVTTSNQTYSIVVKAITSNDTFSQTDPVSIRTLPEPSDIVLVAANADTLRLRWTPYANVSKYQIYCNELATISSQLVSDSSSTPQNDSSEEFVVKPLQPKTKYRFSIRLFFTQSTDKPYDWPSDDRFIFETSADRPSAPGKPDIEHVTDAVFKVSWEPAKNHGSPVIRYSLEVWDKQTSLNRVKRLAQTDEQPIEVSNATDLFYTEMVPTKTRYEEEHDFPEDIWTECYNGSDTYWIIDATKVQVTQSSFRVRALNEHGWGPFSLESKVIELPVITGDRKEYLLLAIFIPVAVSVFVVLAGCMILGEYLNARGIM